MQSALRYLMFERSVKFRILPCAFDCRIIENLSKRLQAVSFSRLLLARSKYQSFVV